MPARVVATVRSLERNSLPNAFARAGDNVTVNLQGVEANRVVAGGVLCHPDFPIKVSNQLELKIVILNITTPLLIGSQVLCPRHLCCLLPFFQSMHHINFVKTCSWNFTFITQRKLPESQR